MTGVIGTLACRLAGPGHSFCLALGGGEMLTNKATYLSDMRITVGRSDTRAKGYNDIIGKKHALFEGRGDVQLRRTIWKPILRLREIHRKDPS